MAMKSAWWHVAEFDRVVDLAVNELYQDSQEEAELRMVVASTLRNVHFIEIRQERDEARALAEQLYVALTEGENTQPWRAAITAYEDQSRSWR